MCIDPAGTYTATVSTTKGDFTIELDAETAPETVNNFVVLAAYQYYDDVAFHRIIPEFMVQGGDAVGDPPGTGGPGYTFDDELPTEPLDNGMFYEIGSVAMANSGPNTNGSQFFVVTGPNGEALPSSYSRFGKVTDGLDTVRALEAVGDPDGTPTEDVRIQSITISGPS
ncbi:MAG: peptidylprolyl isomerase [Acidobacteria bacterium]|nr:peptidylprolyl isomerase [Acidobacteriota bacterium]